MADVTVDYSQVALLKSDQAGEFTSGFTTNPHAFKYWIKGRPMFAFADIYLDQDQSIIADSGALLWLNGGVNVSTECSGGICVSYIRQCSGEPCCFNRYRATGANQNVAIGTKLPGDVMAFGVTPGNGWVLTFDAFVAGTSNLQISTRFSGCCTCECADEAPFITKVTVKEGDMGILIGGGYGMIERHDIPDGESMYVSRGLFFAAHQATVFHVQLIGGCSNICCTGGGVVMKFSGPCCVYTSSKNPTQLLRDFGIPGGRERNLKYVKAYRLVCGAVKWLLKQVAEKAASGG